MGKSNRKMLSNGVAGLVCLVLLGCASVPEHSSLRHLESLAPLSESAFSDLRDRASALDSEFNASARKHYEIHIDYGRALLRQGQSALALESYLRGLQLNAFDLDAQMVAAELEIRHDQPERAQQRLRFIEDRGDDQRLRKRAAALIRKHRLGELSEAVVLPNRSDLQLYLATLGDVPEPFVMAIRSRLELEFRVAVSMLPAIGLWETIGTRDSLVRYADRIVEEFESMNSEDMLESFYERIGMQRGRPKSAEEKVGVLRALVMSESRGWQKWRDLVENRYLQYDADDMLTYVASRATTPEVVKGTLGILCVTNLDLFKDNMNFLFALSRKGASVMSIHRLYRPEEDSVSIGLHRAVVQAMTSFIQILGIPRATSLPCATAYPHSLDEFDAKKDLLCRETLVGLKLLYESM